MRIHIVRPGDTLWKLAKKYDVPLQRLIDANPQIADPNHLDEGMKVRIPTGGVPVRPPSKPVEPPRLPHSPHYPEKLPHDHHHHHHRHHHHHHRRHHESPDGMEKSHYDYGAPLYPSPWKESSWGTESPSHHHWPKMPQSPDMPPACGVPDMPGTLYPPMYGGMYEGYPMMPSMPYQQPYQGPYHMPYPMPGMHPPMYGMPYPMTGMEMPYGCGGTPKVPSVPPMSAYSTAEDEVGESSSS